MYAWIAARNYSRENVLKKVFGPPFFRVKMIEQLMIIMLFMVKKLLIDFLDDRTWIKSNARIAEAS